MENGLMIDSQLSTYTYMPEGYSLPKPQYLISTEPYYHPIYNEPYQCPTFTAPNSYPTSIGKLIKKTEQNKRRLQQQLSEVDSCYSLPPHLWHSNNNTKSTKENGFVFDATKNENNVKTLPDSNPTDPEITESERSKSTPINFCYLCSTLEEHQRHSLRRGKRMKAKEKVKPRIHFVAPTPVTKKPEPAVEVKKEMLYKVSVKTGTKPKSDTTAEVSITLKGRKGKLGKEILKKKTSLNFGFGCGTLESFHIKGPNIGELKSLMVEHNGSEQKHSWYLEYIKVTNLNTQESWLFEANDWLSLYKTVDRRKKPSLSKHLVAQRIKSQLKEFDVTVVTGDDQTASMDSNVFITLYGNKGVSPTLQLQNNDAEPFITGSTDKFSLETEDVGIISRIKVQQDGKGKKTWKLEKVLIVDNETNRAYFFVFNDWLGGGTDNSCFLYPVSKKTSSNLQTSVSDGGTMDKIHYEVSTVTGNVRYGGTDANVFIKIFGKLGVTHEKELDDEKNNFEQGMTDTFKINLSDVGDIKKIQIRHDNTGLGAGWFLEKVIIKRFFSKEEISEKLCKLEDELDEKILQRQDSMSGKSNDRRQDTFRRRSSSKLSSHAADSDDDSQKYNRKTSKISKEGTSVMKDKFSQDLSDNDEELEVNHDKIPEYDEYVFICGRWLALDEDDSQLQRVLRPKSVTTFYKMIK